MNGGHQHQQPDAGADQRPSLSSTTSSDKSADRHAAAAAAAGDDAWRAEAARQWATGSGGRRTDPGGRDDDGGGGGGSAAKVTAGERMASFRHLLVRHWHAAVTYCAVFWSFGMCVAFLGPTLLDLGCITASDMRAVSWVFLAQLLCSLIGASAASYLVKR